MTTVTIIISAISLLIGLALGFLVKKKLKKEKETDKKRDEEKEALIQKSREEGERLLLDYKEKALKILDKVKNEEESRLKRINAQEDRLRKWEEKLNRQEQETEEKRKNLVAKIKEVKKIKEEIDLLQKEKVKELEKIAGLTKEEARSTILKDMEKEYEKEIKESLIRLEKNKLAIIENKAKELLLQIMQRFAPQYSEEYSTTTVELANEEMKGRVIGKEGRNIRTFQRVTGVDLIIDETPNVVTISSFSPLRREIAKEVLLRLIKDGRIQPARIEETAQKVKEEFSEKIQRLGEEACIELGISDLPPKLVYLVGMLYFKTSYGQNLLNHSIEVAHLAHILAHEIGGDSELAKRAGLLHDIGKSLSHEIEGSHIEIGKKLLEKFGIDNKIIEASLAHHEDYPYSSLESRIIKVADALSATRPGARKESYEAYIKRVEELEKLVNSFEGVENSYAIAAGREIRVFVNPNQISDIEALNLAKKISKRIEKELAYPGEIKVNIIRETRVIEYAR